MDKTQEPDAEILPIFSKDHSVQTKMDVTIIN